MTVIATRLLHAALLPVKPYYMPCNLRGLLDARAAKWQGGQGHATQNDSYQHWIIPDRFVTKQAVARHVSLIST